MQTTQFDIEIRSIDSIRPYENNPRKNDQAVDAVATSLREYGFRQPIVVDAEGVIIAGHTRYKAAVKLGLDKIPVHVATDLTPNQVRAYRLADNKTGELAEWDFEILPVELAELQGAGFDMGLLAFNDKELARLLDTDLQQGLTDADAVPEPPDAAITQRGDIWILGDHRLMCGDSAKAEDVDRLLDHATIQLCNTDPPYNVKVEPRSNNAIAAGLSSFTNTHHQNFDVQRRPEKAAGTTRKLRPKDRPLENDFVSEEEFDRLLDAWFGNIARVLEPGRAFYCWGGYANLGNYPPMLKKHDLYFSQGIVWDKQHPVLTRKDFMGAFEICFYGWRLGAGHQFLGPNNATDLWHVKKVNPQSMVHLTEKPVELAVRAIQYSSKPGFGKEACSMKNGLRLAAEEFSLLLGRADGPEGSALGAALESGLVLLRGDLSNDGCVDGGRRRDGFRLPPALLGGDLDDRLDLQFRVGVHQDHEGGGQSRDSFRLDRLGHARAPFGPCGGLGLRGLLGRLLGWLRGRGRRGRRGARRGRLLPSPGRRTPESRQVGLRTFASQPLGRLDADLWESFLLGRTTRRARRHKAAACGQAPARWADSASSA